MGWRRLPSRALAGCSASATSRSCASMSEPAARTSLSTESSCWRSFSLVASMVNSLFPPFVWRAVATQEAHYLVATARRAKGRNRLSTIEATRAKLRQQLGSADREALVAASDMEAHGRKSLEASRRHRQGRTLQQGISRNVGLAEIDPSPAASPGTPRRAGTPRVHAQLFMNVSR